MRPDLSNMNTEKIFPAVRAKQGEKSKVFSFVAKASELLEIATIDRIGRNSQGTLRGFQRPQIASHIREISDYLRKEDAVLPNPIVVAFTSHVSVNAKEGNLVSVNIDTSEGPPGLVVDGQQRLTALASTDRGDFEVFVSALVCEDEAELKKQFVLINNTRPLPKSLIYELLPSVSGLPGRLESRTAAASITERLNFDDASSLRGQIYQHTNPSGVIRDTAIQRVIMNSLNDGALRELAHTGNDPTEEGFLLISEYYAAVQAVFRDEWMNHTPKSSRLVHGAGIVGMGYVMELLYSLYGARNWREFATGVHVLKGKTAWSEGVWYFSPDDVRPWNGIQNVNREIRKLADYLVRTVRRELKARSAQNDTNVVNLGVNIEGVGSR